MASSSSSSRPSHSNASSSSQPWNYDVFLSFRGEDTRKTFVGHLYAALERQGIHTYKDDETLPRGEFIGSSLRKAIKESQIAVIVFSKNYADSSWCLNELSYIMKCKDKKGQIVFPIFYDVDPSEVRKQKRKYEEAFAKHELENKSKVESWRKALVDAANLSGWETKNVANGNESKCIEKIVDTISRGLRPLISSVSEDLIGIETRMQDFIPWLEITLGGVRMVGIWGVGGGGKTTLASAVYKEISRKFDGCSFIENVREKSTGLIELQEKVISDVLNVKIVDVKNVEEGKCRIKNRFRHKSVLIVLDDVDNLDHLEALAGSHDWFGDGSRIIITTRDEHLLNTHRVDVIYGVHLLNDGEAIQLLRRHAYRKHKPVEDYEMLSLDVVSYAAGLPLALKILGSFLYDKDKNGWMSALARLKDIPNPRIIEKLRISYDGLQSEEKELFLDIACLFRRWPKNEAMDILDARGFYPGIGVTVLIQKALITISNGMFDMHDLVQEMGLHIVRGENRNNPEKHSRVWRKEDVLDICYRHKMMENDMIEVFRCRLGYEMSSLLPRLPRVVSNMKKLRLLYVDIGRPNFSGNGLCVDLADEIEFLSSELQYISWHHYYGSSLPTNYEPTKLVGLILHSSQVKQLWMGYKNLPGMKVLDLSLSYNLIKTPDFYGLPNLERLELRECTNLVEIHQSIGHLKKLVYLTLHGCIRLEMFPPIVKMEKLETLILSCCNKLQKFPEIKQNMDSLEHLDLHDSGIEVVPSSVGQYCSNLVSIDLHTCHNLRSIDGNFHLLKRLKLLNLNGCIRLVKLPDDLFDGKHCLEELFLPFFRQSLSSLYLLRVLRKLNLSDCNLVDGDIPSDIGEISNLQELDLSFNKFSQLPSSLSQLPRLKFLNLSFCKNLLKLPELPSSIAVVRGEYCESLETVGDLPTNCNWLWNVSLRRDNKQGLIGGDRLLQSMLQGNAIEHHFLSLILPGLNIPKGFAPSLVKGDTFTLQLPHNWSNDFVGFLMCTTVRHKSLLYSRIIIEHEMDMHSKYETWKEESNGDGTYGTHISYFSFSLLKHTRWWSSTYSKTLFLSVHFNDWIDGFGVGLVPRKSKGDPTETMVAAIDCFEFWDEASENKKAFRIIDDSESSIDIMWCPHLRDFWG